MNETVSSPQDLTKYDSKFHVVKKKEFLNTAHGMLEDMEDTSQIIHMNILAKFEREEVQQKIKKFYVLLIVSTIGLIYANIMFRKYNLKKIYKESYLWYESEIGRLDTNWPPASGPYSDFSIEDAAISFIYPSYSSLLNLQFKSIKIPQSGGQFLLIMTEHFALKRGLRDVHWAGSAQQTGLHDINTYLPKNKNLGEVWHAWNHPNNIWKTLYPSYESFAGSEAIQDYLFKNSNNIIKSLFEGGLLNVAMNQTDATLNGRDLVRYLMGQTIEIPAPDCSPARRFQEGMDTFNMGMMIVGVGMSLFGGAFVKAGAFATKTAIAVYSAGVAGSVGWGVAAANSLDCSR